MHQPAGRKKVRDCRQMAEQIIDIESIEHALMLFGSYDGNVKAIEQAFGL